MDIRTKLKEIKVRSAKDKQTIAEAIEFVNAIVEYGEKQKAVFELLGYVPKGK